MADKKKTPKNKPLFGGFDRLQSFPLDSSSVFDTWEDLTSYCKSNIAYHGQLVVCLEEGDHYGAYIIQDKTGGGSTIFLPYKLSGAEEFTKSIGILKSQMATLREDLDTLKDEDIVELRAAITKAQTWIDNALDQDGNPIFATKAELEEETDALWDKINEIMGPKFNEKLDTIKEYEPTINSIYRFIQDYGSLFESYMYQHGARLTQLESITETQSAEIDLLELELIGVKGRLSVIEEKFAQLDEHERRISSNEQHLKNIDTKLESVEHFVEYDFGSLPTIGGIEFTPNMVIKEIEIVINETGDNVVGGIFNDNTKLLVDFPSTNNPQNIVSTVISASEILLIKNMKMIFDLDFQPEFNGHLRFHAENSEGMSGHAYVRYFERIAPVEEEPEEPIVEEPEEEEQPIEEGGE